MEKIDLISYKDKIESILINSFGSDYKLFGGVTLEDVTQELYEIALDLADKTEAGEITINIEK